MAGKRGKLLVVDDEDSVRKVLCDKLLEEGYSCQQADGSKQALDRLKSDSIELVLLDIKMPGKSGMDLLPEIKELYPDTSVIMVTAIDDAKLAIKCMKAGAYDYITKPFDLDELALDVERALDKRRLEIENREYQQHLEQRVEEQARSIREAFVNSITALANALEAKDNYTSGHSYGVTELAVGLAREFHMAEDDIEKIRLAGLLHDIGKIGVKEAILNKPGRLTEEEYQHVKTHPDVGVHILDPVVEDGEILELVRHHHERYDGAGYPGGLKGKKIPLGARIMAVADAYNAMVSERPYRRALSHKEACAELERFKGTQFCPEVVDVFLKKRKSLIKE